MYDALDASWNARINARPAVKKAFEIKASLQK